MPILAQRLLETIVATGGEPAIQELQRLQKTQAFPGAGSLSHAIFRIEDQLLSEQMMVWESGPLLDFMHQESQGMPFDKLVISLHGIRTRGTWQKQLTPVLNQAQCIHEPLDYGFLRAVQILLPFNRTKHVRWFLEEYTRIRDRHPNKLPSIIAHSFGTYLVACTMELYSEVRFDQIILCGSIIPQDYSWEDRRTTGQATRILNECGKKDHVVKLAAWAIADAGPSGAYGFKKAVEDFLYERYNYGFRHSDYLYRLNYQENWIPFLQGGTPPNDQPHTRRSFNWRFYLTISIATLFLVWLLWKPGWLF